MNNGSWREGLFEPFEKLIQIEICNSPASVPENNKLLRCFQFLRMEAVSLGDYCWNGDCTNCLFWYVSESGDVKSGLACRTYPKDGLVISGLSESLRNDLNG